jgi:hypothetical protein
MGKSESWKKVSAQTAAQALEELRRAGLLTDERLCIKVYVVMGDIGKLKIDIQNAHNSLSPEGKEEQLYLEIVQHLTREDVVTLGDLLKKHYLKSL